MDLHLPALSSRHRKWQLWQLYKRNLSYFELNLLSQIHCRLITLVMTYTWFTQRYYVGYTNAPEAYHYRFAYPNWGCISLYDLQYYRDKGYRMITVSLNFDIRYNVSYNCLKIMIAKSLIVNCHTCDCHIFKPLISQPHNLLCNYSNKLSRKQGKFDGVDGFYQALQWFMHWHGGQH